MAERLHRTEILLEPEQHQKLTDLAEREGRSLSVVVDPLSSLRRAQEEMRVRRDGSSLAVDVEEMIREMREERDEEILTGLWSSHP